MFRVSITGLQRSTRQAGLETIVNIKSPDTLFRRSTAKSVTRVKESGLQKQPVRTKLHFEGDIAKAGIR